MKRARSTPTEEAYTELQRAYDFFNTALFAGASAMPWSSNGAKK
jgi:hypothetical protein